MHNAEVQTNHQAEGIGAAVPRVDAKRLVQGQARYCDDIELPRMVHVCFLRSPYAHARMVSIDTALARAMPGVVSVLTGADLRAHCEPFLGVLKHLPSMVSAPQWPLAMEVARWQGEPVVMVAAQTRALAEDAVALVEVQWEPLEPVVDPQAALAKDAPAIHAELENANLAYEARVERGDYAGEVARSTVCLSLNISTTRVTAVTLEPRGVVADWDTGRDELTVWMGTQVPHMMQSVLAQHLRLAENRVRVVSLETGGSFGLKIHAYPDEFAAVVLSKLLGRPVKFVADRLESFSSDVHARAHDARVEIAVSQDLRIRAFGVDGLLGIGAYSKHPRGSVNEIRHVVNLLGAPYQFAALHAHVRAAFQNKTPYGMYRGVGHPIVCLLTEMAVECAARQLQVDSVAFRFINYRADSDYPAELLSGTKLEALSHEACLHKLVSLMDYPALRQAQAKARLEGRYQGIGLATFVENSNHGSSTYGRGGAPIAANDGCTVRLQVDGTVLCASGATDTGQGSETALSQIVAHTLSLPLSAVRMQLGDTASAPVGGGNWGSRGTGVAGEAALQASLALKEEVLRCASVLWDVPQGRVRLQDGQLVDELDGQSLGALAQLCQAAYVRPDLFKSGPVPQLAVTRFYAQRDYDGGIYTNGVQASWVEVDIRTGCVRLLKHWVVDDCGVVINPALADEQLRGAVVQGIGQALLEGCLYDDQGQLMNATMAEYLTPMAGEMPDICVAHVVTPTRSSALGAKGVAEAGITGAIAAVVNAVNDALYPLNGRVTDLPITPDRIFKAIGAIN